MAELAQRGRTVLALQVHILFLPEHVLAPPRRHLGTTRAEAARARLLLKGGSEDGGTLTATLYNGFPFAREHIETSRIRRSEALNAPKHPMHVFYSYLITL